MQEYPCDKPLRETSLIKNVLVVDYGMGNLKSVQRAFEKVGAEVNISSSPLEIADAETLVLPGVGSFGRGMEKLQRLELDLAIRNFVKTGKPLLGICLGMQLLFETSTEFGNQKGLGILAGAVQKIPQDSESGQCRTVPNVGWHELKKTLAEVRLPQGLVQDKSTFYFTHSFSVLPDDDAITESVLDYCGYEVVASVRSGNVLGVQFHPEKSGLAGLGFLERFLRGETTFLY